MGRALRRPIGGRAMLGLAVLGFAVVSLAHAAFDKANVASGSGTYRQASLALESALQTDRPATGTRLALGPGGRDVRLAGELTEGVAARLARLVADNPGVARVHLTSDGGLVAEGQAIGEVIAAHGLATYVPDFCVSACTLALVRGRERFILKTSRIGFHAPYEPGLFGQTFQADSTAERALYIAAGVAADFVDVALRVTSDDLWLPEARTLLAAGVATAVVDARRFPDSTLDDAPDLDNAREVLRRNFAPLRMAGGGHLLDAIAGWYLAAYESGVSEADAVEGIERLIERAIAQGLSRADDATMIALGRYLVRAMDRTKAEAPSLCARIGGEANLLLARETLRKTDEAIGRLLLLRAAAAAGDASDMLDTPAPTSTGRDCAWLRQAYSDALAIPSSDVGALRALMFSRLAHRRSQEASVAP